MKPLHILIDDVRNLNGMDIIIRTPVVALDYVRNNETTGHVLYMDNDLSSNPKDLEGQHILRQLLDWGQRPKKVVLVTANPVAAQNMREDLKDLGYKENPNRIEYDLV